jgi:hypothetical protein
MRRTTTKYLLSAGLITLGSLALVPSCVTNDSSIFIVGVIDIDAATCLAKADTTEAMRPSGTLDTHFSQGYTAALLIGNQLTQQGSREQLRTETSRVSLRGAEVTLTTLDGKSVRNGHYSTVATGFVDAAAGDAPSYASVAVNIIPPGLTGLPAVVLAKIRVFGNTLGGTSVTSSEIDFPITVCVGCLVRYASTDADMTLPTGSAYMCSTSASSTTTSTETPPCVRGQDLPFSCTLCSGSDDLCRDPSLNPSFTPAATP